MVNVQAFKDGDIRFLICTDVAARGLDITGLPYVINVTLPDRAEDYIHRVGRVGMFWHFLSSVCSILSFTKAWCNLQPASTLSSDTASSLPNFSLLQQILIKRAISTCNLSSCFLNGFSLPNEPPLSHRSRASAGSSSVVHHYQDPI